MTIVALVAIGAVVGIIAHLILRGDGYSWFGEIIVGIVGAFLLGLIAGILSGARDVNSQVVIAALIGSVLAEAVLIVLTFRSTGRLGQASQ